MQTYLAIFKRDAQLQPLNIPMPIFLILVFIILLLVTNTVVTGILLLFGCLFCSTLMVNELKAVHAHQLAFILPSFKIIQFNYCLVLCMAMAITTGFLLASDLGEMIFWFMFTMFVMSLIFLLVNHRAILVMLSFITSVILFTIILTLLDGTILIKHAVGFVAKVFSIFGEAKMWVAALILGLVSWFNVNNSRSRYMHYRQYQEQDLPKNWQSTATMAKTEEAGITSMLLPHKFYRGVVKFREGINNWLQYGSNPSSLTKVTYDSSVKGHSLIGVVDFLVILLIIAFVLSTFQLVDNYDYIYNLMLGLLSVVLVNFALSKEFINMQTTFGRLWLMDPAPSRWNFCHKILLVFAKRYLRAMCVVLVLLMLCGLMVFDLATTSKLIMQILLSVFWTGILTAIVTLLVMVKWPSSVWNTKIVAMGIYPPYFAISFFDLFKMQQLSVLALVVVTVVLMLALLWSVRYWQNNGLQ